MSRTRRMLREALITLMMERGWDSVSVQDVCDRADVGRSTFYTHFADKEDLLIGGFDDLRQALRADLAVPRNSSSPFPFARGMIQHAREHYRLFRALVGKRSGQVVLERFRDLVVDLVREDVAAASAKQPNGRDVAVQFIAGGFLQLLTWWLESRAPMPPEQLEQAFSRMAAAALNVP